MNISWKVNLHASYFTDKRLFHLEICQLKSISFITKEANENGKNQIGELQYAALGLCTKSCYEPRIKYSN